MRNILSFIISLLVVSLAQSQILMGTSFEGGSNNNGVLFQFNASNSTYTKKIDFDSLSSGSNPFYSIMQASDGKLYGLTTTGGVNNKGVLFQYDLTSGILTKKIDFDGTTKGANPYSCLVQASNGKLYGMTNSGGVNGKGVIFEFDPLNSTFVKKFDFSGTANGAAPTGALMQATNGKLYGMTSSGGANNFGVLFQYDLTNSTYTKKIDFSGTANGAEPHGYLRQASDGKLYGMTKVGGANGKGVLFQFDPVTSIYVKKVDFSGSANGAEPNGSLVQASDGNIYGMTRLGGTGNTGVLFQFNPTNSAFSKKVDFLGSSNGSRPYGSLIQATDGKLYGMTYEGGINNMGVLFQYNISNSTYSKKLDFNGSGNGQFPINLLEAGITSNSISTLPLSGTICPGTSVNVTYSSISSFSLGNVFSVQLSNASGSFSTPVTIGSITATGSGTISAFVPLTTATSTLYRVRVVGTNPAVTGSDNGSNLSIFTNPTVSAVASSPSVCSGSSLSLIASGATNYSWIPGSYTGSVVVINPLVSTSYSVLGFNAVGCTSQGTVSVSVLATPVISVVSVPTVICSGVNATLTANGATSCTWNPTDLNGITVVVSPTISTTYTVFGTLAGCTNSTTVSLLVNSAPALTCAASPSAICAGSNATLSAFGSSSYFWSPPGISSASIAVNPSLSVVYTITSLSEAGCASSRTVALQVNQPSSSSTSLSACNSFSWNSVNYTTTGVYSYSTTNALGCDSIAILHLTINNSSSSSSTLTACNSYLWNSITYTTSGIYTYSTVTAHGCDSIAVLHLTINNSSSSSSTITTCNSYVWNSLTYTTSGIYTYSAVTAHGCDSIAVLHLTINNSSSSSYTITSCNSYVWNSLTYTTSGVYTYSTVNSHGCDSIAVLHLTINSNSTSSSTITTCNSYMWNSLTYTTSGVYTYSTVNSHGCDSIAVLHLTINYISSSSSTITTCNSYVWNSLTYTTSGIYTYSTVTSRGCDSTAVLYLTISNSSSSSSSITTCNSYVWNSLIYTTSGIYTYSTVTSHGCDSIAVLHLTIGNSSSSSSTITACNSYVWNSVTYTASGMYTYSTLTSLGCNSISVLHLTINNSSISSASITACNNYLWNLVTYTASGIYTYSTQTSHGCDSTAILHLTIHQSSSSTASITACNSYSWNAITYTSSGVYTYTTLNAKGCDSSATLFLTIHHSTSSTNTVTSCNSYLWNNSTYTLSGTYTYSTINSVGCDSIAVLNLIVHHSSTSSTTVSTCNSYFWNATTYTNSGVFTHTTLNAQGCDSIATLFLTIRRSTSSSATVTACRSYTWNAITYTTSGIYTYSASNVVGCDSTATLHLNIITLITSVINQNACDNFTWHGNSYTTTGDYTFLTTSVGGCDSIAILSLTVHPSPIVNISPADTILFCPLSPVTLSANVGMSTYLWSNSATTAVISTSVTGSYSLQIVDQYGCTAQSILPVILVNISQADFDNDGDVDSSDFLLFAPYYGSPCTCPYDLDGDGDVDINDFILFAPAFGSTCL